MANPMFARTVWCAAPCRACKSAGRQLVVRRHPPGIWPKTVLGPVHLEAAEIDGETWVVCPVCDQAPADAPEWECG